MMEVCVLTHLGLTMRYLLTHSFWGRYRGVQRITSMPSVPCGISKHEEHFHSL